MSTAKTTNGNITERLIALVKELADGNGKKFAEKAGIKQATFHNYLNGRTPKADFLNDICSTYNVNLNWLISGRGHKFITDEGVLPALDPDPEIASMLSLAKKVLTSGNPIAYDALERNIKYFAHAVDAEIELQQLKDDVKIIKEEFQILKRENLRFANKAAEAQSSKKKVA